ncbi:MAG: glycosyltransferase family 2 protein [bacterium]|nr:glycosyltransferase family 2 protein [bacterium]
MFPHVSVIIASWNRKEDLRRTLKSVEKQDYKNFEVIVIDNGSTDGSVGLVEKSFPSVRLHRNKENLGVSIAKNQGVILSTGSYVHFLDSDIEMVHNSVISNMVKILQEHPEIGALGGEAYKVDNGVITKRKEITGNCETSTYIMETDDYQLYPCGYIATCNCMMRKKDLEACGGFDTSIMYAGEDKEIGYKLRQMGLQSVVDSRCLVYHYVSDKGRKSVFYVFHKNRIKIFLKNYPFVLIPFLPLLDVYYAFSPKKFRELKQNNKDVIKWVSAQEKKVQESSNTSKFLIVGLDYAYSLVKAYFYNFAFFSETMYIRFKRKDYLKETRKRWL